MRRSRYRRPTPVSVVCYLLLASASVGVVRAILLGFFPKPPPGELPIPRFLVAIDFAETVVIGVCGYFMLQGANWARITFYIGSVMLIYGFLVMEWSGGTFFSIVKLIIMGAVLATPRANRFFTGRDPNRDHTRLDPAQSETEPVVRRSRRRERRYDY